MTRLVAIARAESQSLLVRAAISALAAGVAFALWAAVGHRDFDPGVVLLMPARASAALSAPHRRDRSYAVNALASSLTLGAVSALHVAEYERPIFHPSFEFAFVAALAGAQRSLYAVTTGRPQASPSRDFNVVLAVNVDGRREGWRFAVQRGRVIEVVILDRPSTASVTGTYERFLVLPPVEYLPQPPLGHSFSFDPPRTGNAAGDALVEFVATGDRAALLATVAYEQGVLPVRPCRGGPQPCDATYVERWIGSGRDPDFLIAPPAARSALWLIEVESGRKTVLHEGDGQASARFAPDGQSVGALVHIEDGRYGSLRYELDGRVLAYASGDELRLLEVASGDERVLARGIDPADYAEGALARSSPDGRYLLVQWPSGGIGWRKE